MEFLECEREDWQSREGRVKQLIKRKKRESDKEERGVEERRVRMTSQNENE